ncbi:MAG: tyrosine-type recombinase/integrase [Proteobacteria bacterium]|nr:tyrosine-type recombinase/integrase [Pseudomonadota bacterium]
MPRPRKKNKHLPPCMYFHHGAYYLVKGDAWRRLPATGESTLAAALEAYAQLVDTPAGTMPALIDAALEALRRRKAKPLSKSTLAQYAVAARILSRKLRQFRPEQVQPRHVAGIKVSMAATPNMANRCLSFLRQVFAYALEQQLIERSPCVGVARHHEAKRQRVPSREEYQAVYENAGPRLQVILELLRYTGQRIEDVLHIERAHLVDAGIYFDPQKVEGKPFIAAWTPELEAVVARAKALRGNVQSFRWLLTGRRGNAPDYRTVKLQWDKACAAAGVQNLHLHDLRAMCLTQAKREGLDPQALGRHSSAQMTARYLRDHEIPVVPTPSFRQSN